jgi:hypothetical protein
MPDLKQALKDFVATSNSGKYADEATLLSKFPELKGYNIQVLRDFVATSNSGKYATEDEVFAKFPEFAVSAQPEIKKKETPLALPSEDIFLASQFQLPKFETTPLKNITREQAINIPKAKRVVEEPTEEDYFTGAFGNVLRGIDTFSPIGVGDFVDDIARAAASGYKGAKSSEESGSLLLQGTKPSMEQIDKFIAANKNVQAMKPSAEMQEYQKIYEKEGKGFFGVIKGLVTNPTVLPELITSSLVGLATNRDALLAGGAAVGTGTAYGAATGAAAGGVGAIPGAIAGATAAMPYAFGLASSVLESGSTFGELLTEELKGKEMTRDNVKAILEDPEKYTNIRNKAVARGLIIGTANALTGKLASSVGAKVLSKSAAKSATGVATKGAVTRAVGTGAGIEAVGGSLGEAAARGAIGQEMDVSEIALEGLAELPGGIRSTVQARLAKPTYKVNGDNVTAQQVDELINTMNPKDLAKTKIEIKNDYEGREFKIQDIIVTDSIKEQVKQGNPELNEPSLNAITQLEKDLKKLEGNTTQTGKDKAAAIRGQIKNIQENQLQEEAVVETAQAETAAAPTLTPEQRVARIAELEVLVAPDSELSVTSPEWSKAADELQTLKKQQDAIQKQTTDEGVLRTEQPEVGLQQVVEGDQGPQVVTTGTQEVITDEKSQEIGGQINELVDDYIAATFISEGTPSERRVATRKSNKAFKKLADFFGFQFGDRADANKAAKQDALSTLSTMINQSSPQVEFADVNELMNTYKEDKAKGVESPVVKSVDILFDIKPTVSLKTQPIEEITQQIKELEKEKVSLTSKALKQMPNSPIQLEIRARINQINNQITNLKTQQNEQVQSKRTGDGGRRADSRKIAPLKGAPSVKGINGPDPQLVAVAEDYAAKNGIDLKRQSEYVEVDEDRAKRIADAYEQMANDPRNPKVKEAYQELIKQTMAQYQALVDAGYKFWFMDLNIPSNVEYASSPYNALRDIRENKEAGVFPTTDGFGTSDFNVEDNPLLAETGIMWPVGGLDGPMKPVLANDLFRAVHDTFGHGLEGSGFRARGEENAWQAHVRLFTGPAIGAITSETRGQNSWLNYGPNGETNRTAKIEDTIFADQKVGLMPEWTWTEGRAGDMEFEEKAEVVAEPVEAEPTLIIEEEQFIPMQASEVKTDAFTKDNAIDYLEDEKETESGRTVTYISSLTVEARNADGDPIGTITKLTDEDKMFSFTAEDIDGNEIGFDGFETLGEAKQAVADSYNKIKKKEFTKEQKKKAKEKAKVEAKKAKAKVKAEPTVEEQVTGALDDLLALDPNDKTTLQKIQSGLDKVIKDIDKFEKENLGVNIALPVMKTILKAIKALVDAGVTLQEAIKRVAKDNNVNSRDVIDGINAVSQIAPIQAQYDALMTKADELIARQKSRGIADAKIVSNLDTLIRNSEVYKNANDAQKKIMEREARTKMGAAPKRAVSIGRVLGALKDITNISREEKMLVIKQIRDLSRDAAKELAKDIREMASKGKITSIQAANIVSRFGKVNMLNEISVSNFVDYMAKVFANAEYADKIDVAKSKLKMAKKNIVTKIGIADGLVGPLNRLFSINPTLIPNQFLGRYLELVDMFGARQAVLTLDEKSSVTKDVEAILNEIDNEQSKADELADRFNASENKVFKDDELDYAASVKKMLDEKEIDDKEAETMRKYKDDIAPQVEETELTEDELADERKELTDAVKKSIVDGSELSTKDERDLAKELSRLIKTDAVDGLTNTELKNLLKVIGNINNNYLPHYTQLMVEKMNAINNGKVLTSAIKKSKVAPLSGLYSRAKSLITKKGAIFEMIRRNPLFNIDQLFGDFKTKDIFNSILNKAAEGEAKFSAELKKVQNILEKAEEKVAKSFKLDPNKTLMSKFKMMTYMIQLEFESNKGNKEVNPAANYLKATIKHIDAGKSQFAEREAEMLQDILNQYSDADGNIDNEKLYNSFNQAEKDAIKDIRGVNESLREKAEYTAAIIRGDRISPLNNYVHLNVLHEHQPNDLTSGSAFITEYNDSMRPSTKAKSLIARTGKVSPLNFDVFASAQRGAKFVLMDYNLTEPIRTARKTINQTVANLEQEGRIPKEKREIINAINSAFEEAIENLLTNTYVSTSIADDVIDYINKQGYRAILAGTGRFASELMSNIGFALISDPKAFTEGVKYKGIIMSTDAPLVMENVNSKQTNRIFPTDTLSGKLIDTSILNQASGIKGGKAKNTVANKIQQIWNLSGKKYTNLIELQADALISTPDKAIMRPMWFGSFANQFKNITGKEVDFEKIAANDEAYMQDNKEAIDKAKTLADERSVMTGATDNAFMGILKGTTKPNQSATLRAFNNFNNFMTRFLIFEFVTARTAINAAMGNGSLDKKQGAALLGAVTTRMIVYTLLTQMMGAGLMGLFFDDEEEETEKSFMQKLGQAFTSAFTSLTLGRDFGNATKMMVNYGLERVNENYLDFLREGDYDPYKDAIQYSIVPAEQKGRQRDLSDFLLNMGGAFGPALKTADFITRKALESEKTKEDAIARREKELNVRMPLEILGNAGFVPLYKDIRKAVMKDLYKDLENAERTAGDKKQAEAEKLQGFQNQEDMKRYDYDLWYRTFGPEAPDYDAKQAEKLIKREKDSLNREMKDEMYDYTPKSKKGFGSSGFGGGKSKGGFGTSKFGQ